MKRFIILIFIIAFAKSVSAREYMFVHHPDKYVNVHTTPDMESEEPYLLYNFQIVVLESRTQINDGWLKLAENENNLHDELMIPIEIDEEEEDAEDELEEEMLIVFNSDITDDDEESEENEEENEPQEELSSVLYVHSDWLREIPKEYYPYLDSLTIKHGSYLLFVASVDHPEILVVLFDPIFFHEADIFYSDYLFSYNPCVDVSEPDELYIFDLRNGEVLEFRDLNTTMPELLVCDGRIIFKDANYEYSFYNNRNGKLCRGLTPYSSYTAPVLTDEELEHTVDLAIMSLDDCENDSIKTELVDAFIGKNNFDYLAKLRRAFFNKNKDAILYYPEIIKYFSADENNTSELFDFKNELWSFLNRGETILEITE